MTKILDVAKNNKKNLASIAAAGIVAASTSGCCAIFNNEKDTITITTNPSDAIVYIDYSKKYTTPATLELTRTSDHSALIEKEGYETKSCFINRRNSYWLYVDILWGLMGPFIVPVPFAIEKHYQRYHSFDNLDIKLTPKAKKE